MTFTTTKEELTDYKNRVSLYHQNMTMFILSNATLDMTKKKELDPSSDELPTHFNGEEIQRLVQDYRAKNKYPTLLPNI